MGWTQPVCENKFKELFPDREPVRLKEVSEQFMDPCCFCGTPTAIYIRLDPTTVPHPFKGPE